MSRGQPLTGCLLLMQRTRALVAMSGKPQLVTRMHGKRLHVSHLKKTLLLTFTSTTGLSSPVKAILAKPQEDALLLNNK